MGFRTRDPPTLSIARLRTCLADGKHTRPRSPFYACITRTWPALSVVRLSMSAWHLASTPARALRRTPKCMPGTWQAHPLKLSVARLSTCLAHGTHTRLRSPLHACVHAYPPRLSMFLSTHLLWAVPTVETDTKRKLSDSWALPRDSLWTPRPSGRSETACHAASVRG